MKGPVPRLLTGLLAAALAAGAWMLVRDEGMDFGPATLSADGMGPLRLSLDFSEAERLAFRMAPDSAFSGLGCSGQDEIRYDTQLGDWPISVMGMGGENRIREVEINLLTPTRSASERDCLDLRDRFARPFTEAFGAYAESWQIDKPVSREMLARTGAATVVARWFPTGGSCYISAHFGTDLQAETSTPGLVAVSN